MDLNNLHCRGPNGGNLPADIEICVFSGSSFPIELKLEKSNKMWSIEDSVMQVEPEDVFISLKKTFNCVFECVQITVDVRR